MVRSNVVLQSCIVLVQLSVDKDVVTSKMYPQSK